MDACTQGAHFDEITVHVTEGAGGKHLAYTLERVAVVRYRIVSAGDSALRPYVGIPNLDRSTKLEEVTFGYGRVTWSEADEDDDEDDWRR
jgi:type VI protein secretion system component Hcp